VLDLGNLQQDYRKCNQHTAAGWCLNSSAILSTGAKTDPLLDVGLPGVLRKQPAEERAALASLMSNRSQAVPLEVAVGAVEVHYPPVGSVHSSVCSPAVCSQQVTCGGGGGGGDGGGGASGGGGEKDASQRFCVLSYLFASDAHTVLLIHKFSPGGFVPQQGEETRCVAAARELPHLLELLAAVPGRFEAESHRESRHVAAQLRSRGDQLRDLILEQQVQQQARPADRPRIEELQLSGVRLWYREQKPCHAASVTGRFGVEAQCPTGKAGMPRIVWNHLHTFVRES
jgi:hypothetical protein